MTLRSVEQVPRSESQRRPSRFSEIAVLASLLLITALTAYGSMDLLLWDETMYLARGIDPGELAGAGWEDSLSYSLMYSALSLAVGDPISLYLVGRTLSSVLIVLGVYVAARMNTGALPALVVAGVMAALPLTYIWPGVSGPAAALLVVSAGLVWRRAQAWTVGLAAILVWIAAASRPEFTWVAIAVSVWALTWQLRDWHRFGRSKLGWRPIVSIVGGLGMPLLVVLSFGNVLAGSPRQWTAFVQHFALRNAAAGQDAWANADAIARSSFPTSGSVLQALVENPLAIAQHVGSNTVWLPLTLVGHVLGLGGEPLLPALSLAISLGFFVGLALATLRNRRMVGQAMAGSVERHLPAIVLSGMFFVAFAIPALLVYPRPHYLILPTMLILVAGAMLLNAVPDKRGQSLIPGATTAVGLLVLAVIATQTVVNRANAQPPWEASIRALQAEPGGVRIVSVDPRVCIYVENCVALPAPDGSETEMDFADYLEQNDVNAVLAVPILADSPWGQLAGVDDFLVDATQFGFEWVVPDGPVVIRFG